MSGGEEEFYEKVHQSLTQRITLMGLPKPLLLALAFVGAMSSMVAGNHMLTLCTGAFYWFLLQLFRKDPFIDLVVAQNLGPKREEP